METEWTFFEAQYYQKITKIEDFSLKLSSNELPSGKNVISGEVSVSSSESLMTIDQNTDQAIIEWNSFNIGQNNSPGRLVGEGKKTH